MGDSTIEGCSFPPPKEFVKNVCTPPQWNYKYSHALKIDKVLLQFRG